MVADEIGDKIAESIIQFFANETNQTLINQLKEKGLQFSLSEEQLANTTNKLEGLTFVVSGVFSLFSRDELKHTIEQNGGKVSGSISKNKLCCCRREYGAKQTAKSPRLRCRNY